MLKLLMNLNELELKICCSNSTLKTLNYFFSWLLADLYNSSPPIIIFSHDTVPLIVYSVNQFKLKRKYPEVKNVATAIPCWNTSSRKITEVKQLGPWVALGWAFQGLDVDAVASNTVKSQKRWNRATIIYFWGKKTKKNILLCWKSRALL